MKYRDEKEFRPLLIYVISLSWSGCWVVIQCYLLYQREIEILRKLPRTSGTVWQSVFASPATPALGRFGLLVLLVHLAFALLNASIFQTLFADRLQPRQQVVALLGQLLLATLTLSLCAAWLFPGSLMGDQLALVLMRLTSQVVAGVLVVAVLAALSAWLWIKWQQSGWLRVTIVSVAMVCLLPGWSLWKSVRGAAVRGPDVIVIGVDSLRPDHLARNGAPFTVMPNLERLLDQSVVFTDTLSTQPHTFPSTVSILTGQWPVTNGARGNLFSPQLVDRQQSVAHRFADAGYETVFAMDETRFANIDTTYGFNRVLSPEIGVAEMALGLVGDNVLTNLLSLHPVALWLMPEIYGNRAVSQVYRPDSFSRRLRNGINDLSEDKPMFLYVHFCAGHWPYELPHLYQKDRFDAMKTGAFSDTKSGYLRALGTADLQVQDLLQSLQEAGRLENAVITVLSDHGEDFDLQKDLWPGGAIDVPGGIVHGHGGSAIRSPQVSVMLAVSSRGNNDLGSGISQVPASLIDVAPTLHSLAGLPAQATRYEGRILLGDKREDVGTDRVRFVESSYFPGSLRKSTIEEAAVLRDMAEMYRLGPDGRVVVKDAWLPYQISNRQRAAYLGEWVMMTSGDPDEGMLLINRVSRQGWKTDQAPAAAPVDLLTTAWCKHWQVDKVAERYCPATR